MPSPASSLSRSRGLRLRVPAKVNLVLDVRPRRPDGYHGVRTVLQAVTVFDDLWLAPAPSLHLECDVPGIGEGERNLAWRAAALLREAAGVAAGVRMRLRKGIPLGAGLGGGSADAAAALLGCAHLWGVGWARSRLAALAAQLGSDVPFFLWGGTALGAGRGERVHPLPSFPAWPVLLVRAGAGSATAAAYAALDAAGDWPHPDPRPVADLARGGPAGGAPADRRELAARLGNSFESVLYPARPDLRALRAELLALGALSCVLCGSGSALCALAPSAAWSRRLVPVLRARGAWAVAARFWPAGVAVAGDPWLGATAPGPGG